MLRFIAEFDAGVDVVGFESAVDIAVPGREPNVPNPVLGGVGLGAGDATL